MSNVNLSFDGSKDSKDSKEFRLWLSASPDEINLFMNRNIEIKFYEKKVKDIEIELENINKSYELKIIELNEALNELQKSLDSLSYSKTYTELHKTRRKYSSYLLNI